MTERGRIHDLLSHIQWWGLVLGAVAALVCGVCAFFWPEEVVRAWLPAFLFAWGLSIGCLGLGLLFRSTGGRWGRAGAPFFESGLRLVPATAVFFLPIAFGLDAIYPWTASDFFSGYEHVTHRSAYLQEGYFLLRAAIYFVLWSVIALAAARNWGGAPFCLVVFILSVTWSMMAWVMSLDPWVGSTILGLLIGMSCHMAAMAMVCLGVSSVPELAVIADEDRKPERPLNDLGNLLLATVMLWAYMEFSQLLIIWSGNLPDEAAWYVRRSTGGWQWVAALLAAGGFWLPFTALLFRGLKQSPQRLAIVAVGVLVMQYLALCWDTLPEFSPGDFTLNPFAIVAPIATGGLWVAGFAWQLRRRDFVRFIAAVPSRAEGGEA
jgi:hypothetical protein